MYRSQYDTDCITWSPQGRIFQIEYAMEAVKQGTPVVGLRSKDYAVLCCLKRAQSELASYQQKLFEIDEHMGMAISGLTADARVLANYMRSECLSHKYIYDTPMTIGRLVGQIGDKSQQKTQRYSGRPYGVGLLLAGYDKNGAHIYETCPSGNFSEYKAMAIGGRSQAARTYLEKHFESFADLKSEELLAHGIKALNACTAQDQELNTKNTGICVVGKDLQFRELSEAEVQSYLDKLKESAPPAPATDGAVPMDTS